MYSNLTFIIKLLILVAKFSWNILVQSLLLLKVINYNLWTLVLNEKSAQALANASLLQELKGKMP